MSWQHWAEELRENPVQAVTDLLRGAANVGPYERAAPHEFLLAVLPLTCRAEHVERLGERRAATIGFDSTIGLASFLDTGLAAWLTTQRDARLPSARKLSAYAAQVCEALQWPLYFALPQSQAVLRAGRAQWLQWLASLTLSAFRDPEYDYWQAQAAHQANDELQFFWQSFVVEAGRTRSNRYLNLGLLALANLPLSVDDGLRNLRLQVQSLVNRYDRRKRSGTAGLKELAQSLQGVMARNPSLSAANYRAFVISLLAPLGEDKTASVLSLTGLSTASGQRQVTARESAAYKLKPPGLADETDLVVQAVRNAGSLAQAWNAIRPLLRAHEEFVHKSGDAYYFVRNLDRCARALCDRYSLRDPEIQNTLFQWIHMALRMDADHYCPVKS